MFLAVSCGNNGFTEQTKDTTPPAAEETKNSETTGILDVTGLKDFGAILGNGETLSVYSGSLTAK